MDLTGFLSSGPYCIHGALVDLSGLLSSSPYLLIELSAHDTQIWILRLCQMSLHLCLQAAVCLENTSRARTRSPNVLFHFCLVGFLYTRKETRFPTRTVVDPVRDSLLLLGLRCKAWEEVCFIFCKALLLILFRG